MYVSVYGHSDGTLSLQELARYWYVCVYVYMYACAYVYICACICIYIYTCMCMYRYVYIATALFLFARQVRYLCVHTFNTRVYMYIEPALSFCASSPNMCIFTDVCMRV